MPDLNELDLNCTTARHRSAESSETVSLSLLFPLATTRCTHHRVASCTVQTATEISGRAREHGAGRSLICHCFRINKRSAACQPRPQKGQGGFPCRPEQAVGIGKLASFKGAGQMIVQGSEMTSKVSSRVTTHSVPFLSLIAVITPHLELRWPGVLGVHGLRICIASDWISPSPGPRHKRPAAFSLSPGLTSLKIIPRLVRVRKPVCHCGRRRGVWGQDSGPDRCSLVQSTERRHRERQLACPGITRGTAVLDAVLWYDRTSRCCVPFSRGLQGDKTAASSSCTASTIYPRAS